MDNTVKIFGSPGTGKTTTLLNILEEKISEGYEANKIGFFFIYKTCFKRSKK